MKGLRIGKSKTVPQPSQDVFDFMLPKTTFELMSPADWPVFRGRCDYIGLDTETYDPNLVEEGPGFIRGDAHVVGISLADESGRAIYLPIAHKVGDNYDMDQVKRYVADQLKGDQDKCGANLLYDAEALWSLGIEWKGNWCDVQVAEPLIDEERSEGYSLEEISRHYLGSGKDEAILEEAASAYGVDPKKGLHLLDPKFVGQYAIADAVKPIEIFQQQLEQIDRQDLENVFNLEQRLTPVLWAMRKQGCPIDIERVERAKIWYENRLKTQYEKLHAILGRDLKYTTASRVAKLLLEMGYRNVPETQFGPSISNEWLTAHKGDTLCDIILDLRICDKMKKDFVDMFLRCHVGGRLYPNWVQLAAEEGGTRSGRMASRRVNLQQIPKRNKLHGEMIRSCFIAEEGEKFIHTDFNGQEARITIEVCSRLRIDKNGQIDMKYGRELTGITAMMNRFIEQPRSDFHLMVGEMIEAVTGISLERGPLKNLNFGILYGAGDQKVAGMMAISTSEAKDLKKVYFKGAPFLKEAVDALMELGNQRGFIKTVSGRRRRFKCFQAKSWEARGRWGNHIFKTEEEAKRELGTDYIRAFLHKLFNSVIQGTAGDQTKHALVDLYYDHNIIPLSVVHDEVNNSGNQDKAKIVSHVMENTLSRHYGFRIPFIADAVLQDTWWK